MSKTMSIYAQALTFNRDFAKNQINAKSLGFAEYHSWKSAICDALTEAYKVAEYRYNHMGDANTVAPFDLNALYAKIRVVNSLIGEVNGDILNPENLAEAFISEAMRFVKIATSNEMAHAYCEKKSAKKKCDEEDTEENQANYDHWEAEVTRLENLPGNCKLKPDMQSETTFMKLIHAKLGDAILKQSARPTEEILAAKARREEERKAKRKANKLSKKNAK